MRVILMMTWTYNSSIIVTLNNIQYIKSLYIACSLGNLSLQLIHLWSGHQPMFPGAGSQTAPPSASPVCGVDYCYERCTKLGQVHVYCAKKSLYYVSILC